MQKAGTVSAFLLGSSGGVLPQAQTGWSGPGSLPCPELRIPCAPGCATGPRGQVPAERACTLHLQPRAVGAPTVDGHGHSKAGVTPGGCRLVGCPVPRGGSRGKLAFLTEVPVPSPASSPKAGWGGQSCHTGVQRPLPQDLPVPLCMSVSVRLCMSVCVSFRGCWLNSPRRRPSCP